MTIIAAAEARAHAWLDGLQPSVADGNAHRSWFALGDPQASFERVLCVLESNDLLTGEGGLRADVGLVSMGDHFDFHPPDGRDVAWAGEQGLLVLAWLAAHPPDQVAILLGNHDSSRVQELAFETDESFAQAQQAAAAIHSADGDSAARLTDAFHEKFPHIPTPGIADRDYSAFSVAQRQAVQSLLVANRMCLALAAELQDGTPALLTHAGVTCRELEHLSMPDQRAPSTLASALNRRLADATSEAGKKWSRGEHCALDLSPLHVAGIARREGHGLMYHRPADPDRGGGANREWEFAATGARRFTPRSLPRGLVQVAGHVGHSRCLREMPHWLDATATERKRGGLRTLTFDGTEVRYRMGTEPGAVEDATLVLIDPELNYQQAAPWELLPLRSVAV